MVILRGFMLYTVCKFYLDGFRNMRIGRTLWKIILLKLLVIFAVIKIFFPNVLNTLYDNDRDRAEHVLNHLTRIQTTSSSSGTITLIADDNSRSENSTMEVSRD